MLGCLVAGNEKDKYALRWCPAGGMPPGMRPPMGMPPPGAMPPGGRGALGWACLLAQGAMFFLLAGPGLEGMGGRGCAAERTRASSEAATSAIRSCLFASDLLPPRGTPPVTAGAPPM